MMQFAGGYISRIIKLIANIKGLFSILIGIALTIKYKNIVTPLIFGGKSFAARSSIVQTLIIFIYIFIFSLLCFLIIKLLGVIFPKQSQKIKLQYLHWNDYLIKDGHKRLNLALIIMGVGIFSIFIITNILPRINTETWIYENPKFIPSLPIIGQDFRLGLYTPAENLIKSGFKSISPDGTFPSIYPPLVSVISIPYLLFDANTAYLIHIRLLILANVICLALSALIAKKIFFTNTKLEKFTAWLSITFIFFVMAFYHFSSYSFAFSLERGNVDAFALLFFISAIWVLITQPDNIWLQVILLSVAVHFKIYPAILFVVLLYKHGKKIIIPAISVNLVLLLILGPKFAFGVMRALTSGSGIGGGIGNMWTWIGNHSSYSFADSLTKYYSNLSSYLIELWIIFTLLPLCLWIMAVLKMIKNKYTVQNAVLLVMVSIPLMDLIPTISMDYKLVILSPAALLLFAVIIKQIIHRQNWLDYLQLLILLIILLYIGRPYEMSKSNPSQLKETASFFINNKYLWVLALEGLMVFNIIRICNSDMREKVQLATVDI